MLVKVNLLVSNNQLESRMREIRQSGSVGGKPQPNAASLPQSLGRWREPSVSQPSFPRRREPNARCPTVVDSHRPWNWVLGLSPE